LIKCNNNQIQKQQASSQAKNHETKRMKERKDERSVKLPGMSDNGNNQCVTTVRERETNVLLISQAETKIMRKQTRQDETKHSDSNVHKRDDQASNYKLAVISSKQFVESRDVRRLRYKNGHRLTEESSNL